MKWRRTNKYLPSGKRVSNTFNQTVPPQLYRLGNPRDQMRRTCLTGPRGRAIDGCKAWDVEFETFTTEARHPISASLTISGLTGSFYLAAAPVLSITGNGNFVGSTNAATALHGTTYSASDVNGGYFLQLSGTNPEVANDHPIYRKSSQNPTGGDNVIKVVEDTTTGVSNNYYWAFLNTTFEACINQPLSPPAQTPCTGMTNNSQRVPFCVTIFGNSSPAAVSSEPGQMIYYASTNGGWWNGNYGYAYQYLPAVSLTTANGAYMPSTPSLGYSSFINGAGFKFELIQTLQGYGWSLYRLEDLTYGSIEDVSYAIGYLVAGANPNKYWPNEITTWTRPTIFVTDPKSVAAATDIGTDPVVSFKNEHPADAGTGTILVTGPTGTELRTCKGTPYRNPIAGYRKERICDCCVCSWATVWTGTQQVENTTCPHGMPCPTGSIPTNTIYKDNYSRSCISLKDGPVGPGSISACYDPLIKVKQNKNGQIDEQYNYNSKQYLERRCRGYRQKVFNFQGHIGGRGSKNYRGSCSQCAPDSQRRTLLTVATDAAGDGVYGWSSGDIVSGFGSLIPSILQPFGIKIYLVTYTIQPPTNPFFSIVIAGHHDPNFIQQIVVKTSDGDTIATLENGVDGLFWATDIASWWVWGAKVAPDLSQYIDQSLEISFQLYSVNSHNPCYPCPTGATAKGCKYNTCYKTTDIKKSDCCVTWAPSNRPFNQQGAVSGGSRINRLKYNTIARSQQACKPKMYKHGNCGSTVPGQQREKVAFRNSVNGMIPLRYYRDARPVYKSNLAGICPFNETSNCRGRVQRCSRRTLMGGQFVPQNPTTLCKYGCPQWRSKGGSAVRRRVIGNSW